MRASRALMVTAAACAAVALSAPLAGATNGPREITVNPFAVHQGGTLHIKVEGCGHGGTVTSNAFPTAHLSVNSSGHSEARARIHNHATPGDYNLSVKCSDNSRIATHRFRVLAGQGAEGGLGGSIGPSSTEMAVGGGLVATAAVGGTYFIARRRRTSDSLV
ncbi:MULTISPECIES: hypothetical protein [Streptomyces]|uniref:Integral membrane protein n=2 Tax=Streptomyces niveus TaxID=193462 RepID=A0ABZ1ZWC1_STRNV|nr:MULTISPECIES: hypothetical protein [Streptomyces]TFI25952.1 hypothetical protein E4P36_18895 [Streptomyces sp. 4R-3d]WTA63236.1 hypothetical protein OG211_34480 [Streptomyces niveus]